MKRLLFKASKQAELNNISALRQALNAAIAFCITDKTTQQHILLCLSEALTNLVQHNSTRQLVISFYQDSHRWWLTIEDDGHAWDPSRHLSTLSQSTLTTNEGGRGVALMTELSEKMYYQSTPQDNNLLTLCWQRPAKQQKPSLLIVEDDISLCRLYSAYLQHNYTLFMAQDGFDALEIINQQTIDLIISDIEMPRMSGLELREKLLQQKQTSTTPFIFLTAHDQDLLKQQTAEMGVDDFLVKPITKTDLTVTVNRVLQRSQQVFQQLTNRIEQQITSVLAPSLPSQSHGWNLAVASRNTGFGGGDLLLKHRNENSLSLMIADIMGHDDSAKFFAYAYAGYLHGLMNGIDDKLTPAYLLQQLSDHALTDKLLSKVTLTSCVASLQPQGQLTLACAGHPQPLHIKPSDINYIDVGGILPGLIDQTGYQQQQITVKAGERIAIYTDGLFESAVDESSRNALEQQITKSLHDSLTLELNTALDTVMTLFDQLTANQARDDVMLVLMEVTH